MFMTPATPDSEPKEGPVTFRVPMSASSRRGPRPAAVFGPVLALSWLAWACAPARPATPPPAPEAPGAPRLPRVGEPSNPDPCMFRPAGPPGADTVRVIAGSAFAPRQLYQTLIRLDCNGAPRPDLALAWVSSDGGRTWGFRLEAARFWDGAPVTPEAIAAAWAQDSVATALLRRAGIIFVTAGADGDLRLLLAVPRDSIPLALADPRLAIVRRSPDSAWPVGTGSYRLPESDPAPATLEPVSGGRPLRVLSRPADLRDAVDAGTDLIVTEDPAALAYASGRPDIVSVALPWSQVYRLVLTTPSESIGALLTPEFRESLARDAVRVDARAATPTPAGACDTLRARTPTPPVRTGGRIAYAAADRTARDLASRLAALGAGGARSIVPMDAAALLASLREGRETAYVIASPRTSSLCDDLTLPPGVAVLPLVETRAHALVRRDAPPMTADWDGTPRLLPGTP